MKAGAGEVHTVYNKYLERYTACQVAYNRAAGQGEQAVGRCFSLWTG